ncbi:TonB-dependent siderophore receptor [Flavobacterium sp. ZT3R18]|uniref:TonB-dependent siderophore receptor n=1 Tax=Flavobacterium sp. ZT3R18 TaxID=2594429 RepID=UPI00117BD2A2|nr:TonB-dependent siderophore receptor [Flavobacterium sp. ZT3R18]TRX32403.1 TonB-dependent siderophore receptor [Flavobacterium sp. ZT3R18]
MKYILLPSIFSLFCFSLQAQETASVAHNPNDKEIYYFSSDSIKTANDTVKKRRGEVLKEVVITANKQPKPVTALRSGLKPMDTPQSVQVIDAEIIEQQQAIRLSEVLKNANGVYVGSARGGAQESFFSRGYDMSANNMFKNGFRYNAGSIPDVASLDKVEFLKGGSALLYGNVAPGGILNLVTKTPSFKSGGEISMQMGSNAFYKPSIDFYGPLNKFIAYRISGSYENAESFRDVVKSERIYINPSFLFNVSDKTQITVQGDYLDSDWTPDFGTGIIGKDILDIPRNTYFGALWSTGNTKSSSASLLLNHDFNKNWKLNFNSSFQKYDRTQKSTAQLSNLSDPIIYPVSGYWNRGLVQNKNLEQILGDQLSLQGTFNTGSIKHQVFTGVDWENSFATAYTYAFNEKAVKERLFDGTYKINPSLYDTVNLNNFDPTTQRNDIPNARVTTIANTDTNRFGVYAQDLISITDQIKVLAGIRWSWQESEVSTYKEKYDAVKATQTITPENATADVTPKRLDNAFSPKVGLIFQPTKDMSLFASYSSSFTPNTGLTVDGDALEASIIDQYEAGIKKDFWKGILSTNVTVYQITNSNLAQTAPFLADGVTANTNSQIRVLSGETKSKGVEIDVTARPLEGLSINAGYSYNDMRYTNTSGKEGSFVEGDRVARTPKNTANLSFFYTLPTGILKGLSVGAIGNYVGDRIGGWNNLYYYETLFNPSTGLPFIDTTDPKKPKPLKSTTLTVQDREVPLAGYVTIDASIGYTWKQFSILCRLSNITNELNYTVHENYSVNPIAPRQVMTSLKYKF